MRVMATLVLAALAAGCAKTDTPAVVDTGTGMAMEPVAAAGAPVSLADLAGKWNVRVMGESSDSTLSTYVLTATADTAGWVFSFPNGQPIPMRITSVSGDSVVTTAGPFPSSLRKGAQVSTVSMFRMQDGKMVGTTVARYPGAGADSVARLRTEGTRAQ